MGIEIERKFLVVGHAWRQGDGVRFSQGYLNRDKDRTVRVRLAGEQAFLTIKGRTEGAHWEVDEFLGDNAGLVVAEIELKSESESFTRPEWLGEEVTHDARYFNSSLSLHPYGSWPAKPAA